MQPLLAQVSPGPLARPHAELEGASHCLDCHAGGSSSMGHNCRSCHRGIDHQVSRGLGLHGQQRERECSGCHPDHAGVEFELINWDEGSPERFDHARTGWDLEGRHRTLECQKCHRAELRAGPVADLMKGKDSSRSWLGLQRECTGCHVDDHQNTLGSDCRKCHDLEGFKPAPGFDHAASTFPLDGKHTEVKCERCHLVPGKHFLTREDGRLTPKYKPIPHESCAGCHVDPHRGRLGGDCKSCHSTSGFAGVDRTKFDHDRTRYPLRGRHARLDCAACHDPQKAWGKRPGFGSCSACHNDPHAGQATLAGKVVECDACHDLNGFRSSTFTVKQHQSTSYPLEGKHAQVACAKCHLRHPDSVDPALLGSAGVLMHPKHAECRSCHADAHGGQLAARADGGSCEACHGVVGWKPSTFGPEKHAETGTALTGRHLEAECAACHGPGRRDLAALPESIRLGRAGVAFGVEESCASCHLDVHAGRFAEQNEGCSACHGFGGFRPSSVDAAAHGTFSFGLQGAHRAIPCMECHEELSRPPVRIHLLRSDGELTALRFEHANQRCADCHETPHGDQFVRRADAGGCAACHGQESFRPATKFDHERDAAFSLVGAHARVACESCHPTVRDPFGREWVRYRPVPDECRDCHVAGEMRNQEATP